MRGDRRAAKFPGHVNKRIILAALPGALVVLAAVAALALAADSPLLAHSTRGFPWVALVAAVLLAARLRSTRLFVAALLTLTVYAVMQSDWGRANLLAGVICAICFPVSLVLLAFAKDRGFSFARVRNQLLLALAPILLVAFLSAGRPERMLSLLTTQLVDPLYTDWSLLPQLALLTLLLALVIIAVQAFRTQPIVAAALFWLALAVSCALGAAPGTIERGFWMLAAALVLVLALVELAYTLAFHDELTGLPARRALNQTLANLLPPYAIAVVDVDHFKSFNDQHGHEVGDQVLRMVAARLAAVGGGGVAYRSGGEEFTIVFAGLSKREAVPHVEAVRDAVDKNHFSLRQLPRPRGKTASKRRGRGGKRGTLHVTISVGVAGTSAKLASPEKVIEAADKAMYRAKNGGRNRVVA